MVSLDQSLKTVTANSLLTFRFVDQLYSCGKDAFRIGSGEDLAV